MKAEQQISLPNEVRMGKTVVHFLAQNIRYYDVHYVLKDSMCGGIAVLP